MMFRIALPRELCVLGLLGLMGCAHMVESQAIEDFTLALQEKNYDGLRSATSPQFKQRALRTAEALDDFKILNLPKGETTVVEVQDSSENEKLVTVTAGKLKKKLFYRLVRNGEGEEWVVDDVYIRQRKGGVKVDKSIAEQMDLLLNVREFLTVWNEGTREEVFSVATPELAEVLRELPPMHLSRLCKAVVSEHVNDKRFHPRAQLDNDIAVVTLPRKTGKMILSFKLLDGNWRVSDVAVESRKDQDHIPSVMKTATVLRAGVQFLDAYNMGDKERLMKVCHPKFYESSILPGDLRTVELPDQFISNGQYHIKMQADQADFVIEQPHQVVKVGLNRVANEDPLNKQTNYLIDDVTIYPNPTGEGNLQEMRLSMVFTGHAVLQLFRESLAAGNLPLLRKTATQDFNSRVWQRINDDAMTEFTPRIMTNHIEETIGSEYDGAICKITVRQMGRPVTYVLRDRKGEVAVDDVIINDDPNATELNEVASMKETMELMIPLRVFRQALAHNDMDTLQRTSSSELNRMIWSQADGVPPAGQNAVNHLLAPLSKVEHLDEGRSLVTLGNQAFGCSVMLVTEHDQHVVDDIVLVAGAGPELRARLKHKLREQIALGASQEQAEGKILQAGDWQDAPENSPKQTTSPMPMKSNVSPADFEEFAPLPKSKTQPVPVPSSNSAGFQADPNLSFESQPVPHPSREMTFQQQPVPQPLPEPAPPTGTTAPPLFPGGEADLEEFVPEIKPSDNAFDSPLENAER